MCQISLSFFDEQRRSLRVQKPGTASLYVLLVTKNSTKSSLEDFSWSSSSKEWKVELLTWDLIDFVASVSVLLCKKMEVKYLQSVWYMVMLQLIDAGNWILPKNSRLLSLVLNTPIKRWLSFW